MSAWTDVGKVRRLGQCTPAADVTASLFGSKLPEFHVLTEHSWIGRVLFEPRTGNASRDAAVGGVPLLVLAVGGASHPLG